MHCHDDLGLAVANSLAAIEAGARQIECTVNGIGERAGNCSLEEIVMILKTRSDAYPYHTGIHTEHLFPASELLSSIITFGPQPNKAIVGRNAFAHEAGIHQDGYLKEKSTYEIIDPRTGGRARRQAGARQTQRPARASPARAGDGLQTLTNRSSTTCTIASRRWPTIARKGSMDQEIVLPDRGMPEGSRRGGGKIGMNLNVLVLPGDGIGTEVTREAVRVLRHVAAKWNHNLKLTEGLLGGIAIHQTGSPFTR